MGTGNGNGKTRAPKQRRLMRKWDLPPNAGFSIAQLVMRELDSADDLEAQFQADKRAPAAARESIESSLTFSQRERVRLSVVAVDGVRVNVGGDPYTEMDRWNLKTMRWAERAFMKLNGLTSEEQANLEAGGAVVDENDLPMTPPVTRDSFAPPEDA